MGAIQWLALYIVPLIILLKTKIRLLKHIINCPVPTPAYAGVTMRLFLFNSIFFARITDFCQSCGWDPQEE